MPQLPSPIRTALITVIASATLVSGSWAVGRLVTVDSVNDATVRNHSDIQEIKATYVTEKNLRYQLEPLKESLQRLEQRFGTLPESKK